MPKCDVTPMSRHHNKCTTSIPSDNPRHRKTQPCPRDCRTTDPSLQSAWDCAAGAAVEDIEDSKFDLEYFQTDCFQLEAESERRIED